MSRPLPTPTSEDELVAQLTPLERQLLNDWQWDFPLTATPYADMARRMGTTETQLLECLRSLHARGLISRVGPVFTPHRLGESTLAAMRVPPEQLHAVAAMVNRYPEVNHNYAREHQFNLWFVLTAPDRERIDNVLAELRSHTGFPVLDLPMERDYYINLGFPLWC